MVPLECEFFALRGVALLMDTITKVQERLNEDLEIEGLLATMYDARTLHGREVLARVVEAFGDKVFHTVINRTVRFPDATVAGEPITTFDPSSLGANAYRELAREVLSRWPAACDNGQVTEQQTEPQGFQVHLDVFEGPFDLLLGLISKHKLDITEISLSQVTDEFIAYIRSRGPEWDLDQTSHFLLVAATLLDLKAARLLPSGEVEDEEDLALLEARDLLFARLLQYKAYKEVAKVFAGRMADEALRFPRTAPMEPQFADLLPELILGIGPDQLARIAARAFAPKLPPDVNVGHIYQPLASVREQAAILVAAPAPDAQGHLPGPGRRLRGHLRGHRPLPGRPGALPGVGRHLRAGRTTRRPARDLDRRRTTATSRWATTTRRAAEKPADD